ncbi:MAG TPA: hypothetical protein VNL96_01160, partial [Gemmatimonadaceae bacterium]|nr:hypothetical protein [Gemmatimonadaceae bacterium]
AYAVAIHARAPAVRVSAPGGPACPGVRPVGGTQQLIPAGRLFVPPVLLPAQFAWAALAEKKGRLFV